MVKTFRLVALLSCACCFAMPNANAQDQGATLAGIKENQRKLIARLSGHAPYMGEEILTGRSSKAERIAATDIIVNELKKRGQPAERRAYKSPNEFFLLDLILSPYRGTNVVSLIPSTTGSEEYVVLGAHYDSSAGCPGAIDNATGVALVMAVGDAIEDLEIRHRNFMIVYFDQEEERSVGSKAFVRALRSQGLKLHSAHTVDMVGWDVDGDKAVELEQPTPGLETLYRRFARAKSITIHVTRTGSTDHESFREAGYPAVGITEELVSGDSTPYKDTPKDTIKTVNFDFLASTTLFVIDVMTHLAGTP